MNSSPAKKPVIGIDASRSTRAHPTGVEHYSTEIIKALIPELEGRAELRLYAPKTSPHFPKKFQRILWFPRLWTLIRLSWEMLFHKPDALFVPAHVLPFFCPKNTYTTIHDVAFAKHPKAYRLKHRLYLRWGVLRALSIARKMIVPTEAVKQDLIRYFQAKPSQILVVHHGHTPLSSMSQASIQKVLAFYDIPQNEPLFLFIGRLELKKNLMVLLEAWAEVRSTMGRGVLLLGGMIGHHHLELFERLENPDLAGVHIAAGFMPEHEVSALFQSATGVIIPSREEGFGLPILHAFEGGAAPICSDIPALREVAGNAALYADPKKPSDFAKQIITLMKSQATQKQLVQKGHARLALFSWKHAADEIASEICTKALHCDQ